MNCILQSITTLNIITGCPLVEDTWEVNSKRADNFLGIGGGALVWTQFLSNNVGSNSAYFMRIRSNFCPWSMFLWIELLRSLLSRLTFHHTCNALLNYLIILLGDIVYSYILYACWWLCDVIVMCDAILFYCLIK